MGAVLAYVVIVGAFIWGVYNGDIYPREAGIAAAIFVVLQVVFFLLKLPVGLIVSGVAMLIYLVIRLYGGDITIR